MIRREGRGGKLGRKRKFLVSGVSALANKMKERKFGGYHVKWSWEFGLVTIWTEEMNSQKYIHPFMAIPVLIKSR